MQRSLFASAHLLLLRAKPAERTRMTRQWAEDAANGAIETDEADGVDEEDEADVCC